ATGTIFGNMTFTGGTLSTAHQLLAADASGITFGNGAVFTQRLLATGSVFGTSGTANTIIFASRATFVSQAGSNSLVLGQPRSNVTFHASCLYGHGQRGSPSMCRRAYANFEYNTNSPIAPAGGNALSIDNLPVDQGTFDLGMTGAVNLR